MHAASSTIKLLIDSSTPKDMVEAASVPAIRELLFRKSKSGFDPGIGIGSLRLPLDGIAVRPKAMFSSSESDPFSQLTRIASRTPPKPATPTYKLGATAVDDMITGFLRSD